MYFVIFCSYYVGQLVFTCAFFCAESIQTPLISSTIRQPKFIIMLCFAAIIIGQLIFTCGFFLPSWFKHHWFHLQSAKIHRALRDAAEGFPAVLLQLQGWKTRDVNEVKGYNGYCETTLDKMHQGLCMDVVKVYASRQLPSWECRIELCCVMWLVPPLPRSYWCFATWDCVSTLHPFSSHSLSK